MQNDWIEFVQNHLNMDDDYQVFKDYQIKQYPGTYREFDDWYAKRKLEPKAAAAPAPAPLAPAPPACAP